MSRSRIVHAYPVQRAGVVHDTPLDIIQRMLHVGPFKREKAPEIPPLIGYYPERKRAAWWRA